MSDDQRMFISSSLDLKQQREDLDRSLSDWLARRGKLEIVSTYLWERETDQGKRLSDRVPIQPQLLDVLHERVILTICMFGERCGLPLQDDLAGLEERFARWRSDGSGPGILHPWPSTAEAQNAALAAGAFPLTGTVFELFSALAQGSEDGADAVHLIMGYVANRDVEDYTGPADIVFNQRHLEERIAPRSMSDAARQQALEEYYYPQIRGLLNLLRFLKRRINLSNRYQSAGEMVDDVRARVVKRLSELPGFSTDRNPFKASLSHWGINEERSLPGRLGFVRELVRKLASAGGSHGCRFLLLRGRSGSGKSSVLHAGLLRQLRSEGYAVAAFRPADLVDSGSRRSALDALWVLLCEAIDGCWGPDVDRAPAAKKPAAMANRLASRLDELGLNLVVGLDQFEEILDDLKLFSDERERPRGWWHVLAFLRHMLACPRFSLVGTLESQRVDTFRTLGIDAFLQTDVETSDVPDGADFIERVADEGFRSAGLILDPKLIREIKAKWIEFEDNQPEGRKSSSPLPLAALWLHRLYERFEYRANAGIDGTATGAFRAASDEPHVIRLEDLGKEGVDFKGMIAELADEAWDAGGGERTTEGADIGKPDQLMLGNLLNPFVGLEDGQIQLPAAPGETTIPNLDAILASFRAHRLLVPAGADGSMLRLVHQSVLERWPPAKAWYDRRIAYLQTENDLQLLAKRWKARDFSDDFLSSQTSRELVQEAAQVLNENRVLWPNGRTLPLTKDDEILRSLCLAVFSRAKDPMELVTTSDQGKRFIHVAATYGMTDLIERFAAADPDCLEASSSNHETPLYNAAWADTGAVECLLRLGANPQAETLGRGSKPAAVAVYAGAATNFALLLEHHADVDAPIDRYGHTLLGMAASAGNTSIAEELLRRGANPRIRNQHEGFPLHFAASDGHDGMFNLLLPYGGIDDVDSFLDTPIHAAARQGRASVINAFLSAEIDEATTRKVLAMRNERDMTPLMEAAYEKRPEALRLLLSWWSDPIGPDQVRGGGNTLLHLAVMTPARNEGYGQVPQKDELVRARRVIEILLKDGRFDPNARNATGMTAFDLAEAYEDARRVIRSDERVPRDYDNLTPQMRADDLSNRKSSVALALVRTTPRALSDRHGTKKGIELLIANPNRDVIAQAIEEGLVPGGLIDEHYEALLGLLAKEKAHRLRAALLALVAGRPDAARDLPVFMNAALADDDDALLERLKELKCETVRGVTLGGSVFHELATKGDLERFGELAQRVRLRLPIDDWGRRPSQLSADSSRDRFRSMEAELFAPAAPIQSSPPAESSLFHELAWKGARQRFERLARLAEITVPIDAEGRRPSDLASEADRQAFLDMEKRYFVKEN